MIPLEPLREIAEKCVRCGICQSVCPVFTEIQKESAVARGKVTLIRKLLFKERGYSQKLSTYLLQCLGCGACSENCPNGVRADELILAARALMVEKKGLSLPKWVFLRGILRSVYLLPLLLKTGSLLQGLLLKKIPEESGLHLRFSLPYLDKDRFIPTTAHPFFLDRYSEEVHPEPPLLSPSSKAGVRAVERVKAENATGRIGLFAGCSINYLFPSVGESTVRLLTRSRHSVAFPKDQACCGLPAYGSGDIETAKSLAWRNVEAFDRRDLEQIIVPCGSCFYFLKEGYLKLFPNDEKVRAFSRKMVEPSTFFLKQMNRSPQVNRSQDEHKKIRLTYHDPCHMRRGMKIYQEPRQLLQASQEIEWVEMKQPDRCCGMAGSFNFVYYDLSRKILKRKIDNIEATRADCVATSCMGCLIQLKDGIHQRNLDTRAVHLVEALEKAFPKGE
jgi:glycolate oxidase iron-sulfur subunit